MRNSSSSSSAHTDRTPRELVGSAVDDVGVRLTAPRAAHQREGHQRFTLDAILEEEAAVRNLVDARDDDRAHLWVKDEDTAVLSSDRKRAVETSAVHRGSSNPVSVGWRG